MDPEVEVLIKEARRNCNYCAAKQGLLNDGRERQRAFNAIKELYKFHVDRFDFFRKTDVDSAEIERTKQNKTLCLDAIDACKSCDRETDRINRIIEKLR